MKNFKYKGILYLIVLVILVFVGLYLKNHSTTTTVEPEIRKEEEIENPPEISISSEKIKEENFSGTRPVISGSSIVATTARAHIEKRIAEFKREADTDVPDMREKFGADSPIANYTIDISATQVKSPKTESIVISEYAYTGGANGNSSYKVITASLASEKILSLGDIIKEDKQAAFISFVKKELKAWRPEGSTVSVVFEEEVNNLAFGSIANWSLDNKDLIIYFSKYEIGPGVLGSVAFPLSLTKIKDYLEPAYQ